MSDITDRIEALVKGGATVEVRLSDGITLGPYPVIYAEFTEARLIAFWWAGLDEHEHANPVETWTWDGDLGELTFHCQDNVIVTLGAIWSPDHQALLKAFAALPGLGNIPYPRETGSHYA